MFLKRANIHVNNITHSYVVAYLMKFYNYMKTEHTHVYPIKAYKNYLNAQYTRISH
jgi:hypothetical protein